MSHDRDDDFDRGLANRRAMLGADWVDRATGEANVFNAEFQSLITRYAWHEIWGRPGLDAQTRRLLVLGMTMGQARWEEFALHCGAAIRGGVPPSAIKETLMQGAIYCGVPAANTAFKIALEQLKAAGHAPEPAPLASPSRVGRHFTFSQPQLRVALQGVEQGVPIVLSHALGLDHRMWDALAAELGARHALLRYDHRGHGESARPAGPYAIDDLVDDAARLIAEWGRGPVVFIGLSMGGMVGQGLGVRHPDRVRALVLANTTSHYADAMKPVWAQRIAAVESGGMAAVTDAVVERYLNADFRAAHPDVARALREQLLRCDPQAYVACCHAVSRVDWLDRLESIRVPTLVLAGARDAGATPEMAKVIAERIAGSELEVFDDASHLSVAEQPQRFAGRVRRFIESLQR